jgi:hypothetical protein
VPYGFKRIRLLVRADVRLILASPWYYFILVICMAIVCSFTLIQPRDDLSRVVVIDELDTAVTRNLIERFGRFGYDVDVRVVPRQRALAEFDAHCARMQLDLVYAVIRFTREHEVEYRVYSYLAEDTIRYTLEIVLGEYELEAHTRRLIRSRMPWLELPVEERPLLDSVRDGHDQVGVTIISGIWYLSGIVTLVLWILSKDGLDKLTRVYSFGEILVARVLAGMILGLILVVIFFTTAIALGITFRSLPGLAITSTISVLTGVLSGLMLGALALYVGGSVFSLMLVGLLGITLLFILLTIISGMFIPIGGLPWTIQAIARTAPIFAQLELLRWTALAGHSIRDAAVLQLIGQLMAINAVQFLASLVLFRYK